MTLDAAFTDETALIARLEELLGGEVQRLKVKKVDLVANSTNVDVRFRLDPTRSPSHSVARADPEIQRDTSTGPVS